MPELDNTREIYRVLDAAWDNAIQGFKEAGGNLPCGPGCSVCCRETEPGSGFIPIQMGPSEAALLWEALLVLPVAEREAVVLRNWKLSACPLLDPHRGTCLVYSARPFWCRVYGMPPLACSRTDLGKWDARWHSRWIAAVDEASERRIKTPKVGLNKVIERLKGYIHG